MGQQVLAVAGQVVGGVVGAYFGNPMLGAAIGGAIGGYVGGVLFNEDQVFEGPRLSDLRIQTSNYGNAIPLLYGRYRVAGNVIWSTDIREERRETEEGKGGPTATQVDYNYDLDCAIALGDGYTEVVAIERIYANGVLIYDTRSTASAQTVFASGQWATGTFLYTGSETQLPDPTMEAALGVGNVSAYRGTAYVVITGLQLNVLKTATIPNFEFVVVTAGDVALGRQLFQVSGLTPIYRNETALGAPQPVVTKLSETIRVIHGGSIMTQIYDLNGVFTGSEERSEEENYFPLFVSNGTETGVWVTFDYKSTFASAGLFGGDAVFTVSGIDMFTALGSPAPAQFYGLVACVDKRHYMAICGDTGGIASVWYLLEWDGTDPVLIDQGSIFNYGGDSTTTFNTAPVMKGTGAFYMSVLESDLKHVWQIQGGQIHVWEIGGDKVLRRIVDFTSASLPLRDMSASGSNIASAIYADNGLAAIVNGAEDGSTSWLFLYSRGPRVEADGIDLVDILTDLSERANLPASELSFVNISDVVDGFAIGQTMTARSAMEVLRSAYYFDATDSDTFKFVKRGGASIVDVSYLDLGAGSEAPTTEAVNAQRAQETELPARINVKYLSVAADFQVAAQSARRETTGSREIAEVNLPIVFDDDDEAASIADVLLRERWAGATSRSFSTTLEYAKYEPTDVVRLDDGFAIRTVRVTRKSDKSNLIEWESVDEDVEAYDSNASAVQISVPTQALVVQGASSFEVLDIPPLTELADGNESAAYVAGRGNLANWPGMSLDVSRNDGTTYEPGTGVTQASVMGATLTALANFAGGNVFDEASTVRVSVAPGTLSSSTHDLVLAGANPCVIGNEVLQFRTAALVSTGIYDLSGFLRGRKGTEQHISTHVVGERFVFLSTKLRNLPLQVSDRALDRLMVRGTTGSMLSSTGIVRALAPDIARLMPYSPVHLTAVRALDGSWYLDWQRRDRYMNDWNSGVDVPMSEAAELYDVEIYNAAGDLVETYTDLNDTELDLAADVLGGSPTPASITYSVWQKSAIVGRGFEANETITQAL